MGRTFPHLSDGDFPDVDGVNAYKYVNEFDYSRYDYTQMRVRLCSVPWDMGEAHIGNRTISGIGNVVYFGSKAERDSWFQKMKAGTFLEFDTKFKKLHRDNYIDLPVPFDVAAKYNYVTVDYSPFANDDSFVDYETADGLRKWFWFARETEFLSANSTRVHLLLDAWQTFIYDLNVSNMVLERGHAPLFQVKAAEYLSNPIGKCDGLTAPDIDIARDAPICTATDSAIFNAGSMKAVIITTANPRGTWGTKSAGDWKTPNGYSTVQGVPAYRAFCLNPSDMSGFISSVNSNYPQFLQTVKGICFVSATLLTLGTEFEFGGVTCNLVNAGYTARDLHTLSKADFSYPAKYADLAKLYTYPYAFLELSDGNDVTRIHIEDTDGKLQVQSCLNLVFPWLKIDSHITGIGTAGAKNLSFSAINTRNMPISGNWLDTLQTFDIPVFGLTQTESTYNDFNTHFDRAQQNTAAQNAYSSAVASANAAQSDANDNAGTLTDNAALQVSANDSILSADKGKINSDEAYTTLYQITSAGYANNYTINSTNNSIQQQEAQAAASQASAMQNAAIGAASSLASGPAGAIGAVSAIASGFVSGAAIGAVTEAGINYSSAQAAASNTFNDRKASLANAQTVLMNTAAKSNMDSRNAAQNALTSGTAANSAATMIGNAKRDRNTAVANAGRTRSTSLSAIDNAVKQAALRKPEEFGSFNAGETATTRPLGWFLNVKTQDPGTIRRVGDAFLRYGYAYDGVWDFDGEWRIGKYFTYWKLSDFWVSNLSIPDMYVDQLRFFLFGGVTVWNAPEYIGHVSIYDNWR